ncbi:hypothetical protein NDU88_002060 [Pleurodeles waltl]|uniref:Uncharacterized protein n=1 Tax=Pleurodeles waltl TaxID=8319 RepID=A0AAV7VY96_PLEWA|nr:hypothetical protein NDU88_002060 [Pleurodeles waltl]
MRQDAAGHGWRKRIAVNCGCRHTDVRAAFFGGRNSLEGSGGCLVAPGRAGAAPGVKRSGANSPSGEYRQWEWLLGSGSREDTARGTT